MSLRFGSLAPALTSAKFGAQDDNTTDKTKNTDRGNGRGGKRRRGGRGRGRGRSRT